MRAPRPDLKLHAQKHILDSAKSHHDLPDGLCIATFWRKSVSASRHFIKCKCARIKSNQCKRILSDQRIHFCFIWTDLTLSIILIIHKFVLVVLVNVHLPELVRISIFRHFDDMVCCLKKNTAIGLCSFYSKIIPGLISCLALTASLPHRGRFQVVDV